MASSSIREGGKPETLVDELLRVADGPSAVGAVASRRGAGVTFAFAVVGGVVAVVVGGVVAIGVVAGTDAAAAAASVIAAAAGVVGIAAAVRDAAGGRSAGLLPGAGGAVLLRGAAGLLPRWAACRYREEWAGELYDLRAEGAPWWRRVGYVVAVLLCSVPRLAVALRLGGERSRA